MDYSQLFNTLGLVFNIIGVVVVFMFGFPQPSFDNGASLGLEEATSLANGKTVKEHNEDVEVKKKLYKLRSSGGLLLILVGFILQLIAVWL